MDFFEHRYYKVNKILLELLGLWPYQSIRARVVILVIMTLLVISSIVPLIIFIIKHLDDRDSMMQCAVPMMAAFQIVITIFTSVLNSSNMCELLNSMRLHWRVWSQDRDVHILHEYAEKARTLTNLYTVAMFSTCIVYTSTPVIPKIVDVLLKNGTEPGQFPLPFDYHYIDMQKYYSYVIMHMNMAIIYEFMIGTAHDCLVLVYVYHICGLLAIVRRKLEQLEQNQVSAESGEIVHGLEKSDRAVKYLAWCIDNHNDAIKYAKLLSATYSWYFFFITALVVIWCSFLGIQAFERSNEPEIITKFVFSIVMIVAAIYAITYIGQMLIDHSISIHTYMLQGKWYMLPLETQKLLPMIMMRCNKPCMLTIGSLSSFSMQTFMMMLKTSLSYFTLLRSV